MDADRQGADDGNGSEGGTARRWWESTAPGCGWG